MDASPDYEEKLLELQGEQAKEKPKRKILRKLMADTASGRRAWIVYDRPVVAVVIDVFTMLKKLKYVSCITLHLPNLVGT